MCEPKQNLHNRNIQEMSPNKGPFVEELAEKQSIPDSHLKPLPQYGYLQAIGSNRNNGNNVNGQSQLLDVQYTNVAYFGNNQRGTLQYASQMPYPIANVGIVDRQNVYQMSPAVPYGGFASNTMFYASLPVGHWPNYNPLIGAPGMSIYF